MSKLYLPQCLGYQENIHLSKDIPHLMSPSHMTLMHSHTGNNENNLLSAQKLKCSPTGGWIIDELSVRMHQSRLMCLLSFLFPLLPSLVAPCSLMCSPCIYYDIMRTTYWHPSRMNFITSSHLPNFSYCGIHLSLYHSRILKLDVHALEELNVHKEN